MTLRPLLLAPLLAICAAPCGTPATAQQARASAPNGFTLTFVDADVKRVADAVLGAMLGADYSIDPAVHGTVTLRTSSPVSREELIPLLESALGSVGAALVVQGRHYQVVPRDTALAIASVPAGADRVVGSTSPGFSSEVITIRSGNATQIARLLQQFLGDDIVTRVEPALNQIVISGTGDERASARQIVQRFDVDTLANMAFEMLRLENVDAPTLARELDTIFQPPYDIIGSRVRVIPLPRLRSVLLIASDRADIERIRPWIARLDSGLAGRRRLYSYAVQNGRARDIAATLQQVLGNEDGMAPDPDTGANETREPPRVPVPTSDERAFEEAPRRALPAPPLNTPNGGSRAQPRVIASDNTNSLLIYADGEEYEFIRDALTRLDQPVPQVLIEATLAEVTLTRELQYGINFRAISGDFTLVNSGTTSATPSANLPGFSTTWIGNSASAVLNSLQSRTNVRVLSAPRLVVLNNQTATLQVGDQVPIVTQQVQSVAAPGAPVINNVELRDTGVILRVTPRVNESGTVTLDISQEVSDVARTTTSGINSPTIQQRRIASVVATRSGEMVALGGLIRDRSSLGKSGIPLLSQIPIIGGLFGQRVSEGSRTELIILLTPTLIRAPQDSAGIARQLIEGLDQAGPIATRAIEQQINGTPPPNP